MRFGVAVLGGVLAATAFGLHFLQRPALAPSDEDPPPMPRPRGYVCHRAVSPITIDGKLDDAAWASAAWSEPFRDIEGDLKPDPRLRTRMKMAWDDTALYIAAEMEEPHLQGTLRQHDSVIFQDNDFEVFLDPDGDGHLYGELELNVLNTTWDLLLHKPYRNGGRAIDSWEITGLRTATHFDGTINDASDTDRGWTVEIAVPFRSLRELVYEDHMPPRDGDRWRINFSRVEWDWEMSGKDYVKVPKRPENNWVWSPQGVIDMHRPERWGVLLFSDRPAGSVAFSPHTAQPARDWLHAVSGKQDAFRKRHARHARSLGELGATMPNPPLTRPTLETTSTGWTATVTLRGERWQLTHDGRLTRG